VHRISAERRTPRNAGKWSEKGAKMKRKSLVAFIIPTSTTKDKDHSVLGIPSMFLHTGSKFYIRSLFDCNSTSFVFSVNLTINFYVSFLGVASFATKLGTIFSQFKSFSALYLFHC
jgi:hypothetical protein